MIATLTKKKIGIGNKLFVLVGVLLLFAAQAGAAGQKKTWLGIQGGWSFGGSEESSGMHNETTRPTYHLGAKIQFELCESFGLELHSSFQAFDHKKNLQTSPVKPPNWVVDRLGGFTLALNGVLNSKTVDRMQFYFLGGGGLCLGSLGERLELVAGGGTKIFLNADLRTAVNVRMTYHMVLNAEVNLYSNLDLGYLQLGIGYEFDAHKK